MIYVFGRISLLQSSLNTRHKRSRVCWEVLSHQPLLRSHFSHSSSLVKETALLTNGLQDQDEKICQSTLLNAALACFLGQLKFLVLDRLFFKKLNLFSLCSGLWKVPQLWTNPSSKVCSTTCRTRSHGHLAETHAKAVLRKKRKENLILGKAALLPSQVSGLNSNPKVSPASAHTKD